MANNTPDNFKKAFSRIQELASSNSLGQAIGLAISLRRQHPQNQELLSQLALMLTRAGRTTELIRLLTEVPASLLKASDLNFLGSAYFLSRRYDDAADTYAKAKPYDDGIRKLHGRSLFSTGRV